MDKFEIFEKVKNICKDVFENDELILTENSSMSDIEKWDSLTHLSIISDIEDEFNISFTLDEISNSKSIERLIFVIQKHL